MSFWNVLIVLYFIDFILLGFEFNKYLKIEISWTPRSHTTFASFLIGACSLKLSISNNKTKYSVWVISDKRQNITDTLFINSYDLDGIKTQKTRKINIDLTKFGSHKIIDDYQNISPDEFIIANFKNQDISSKTIFTSKIKDLQFVKPTYKVGWSKNQLKIQVDKPAFQVYFELAGIKFESNYLTLLPNVEYTINYSGILINKENLLIWSLYDLNK